MAELTFETLSFQELEEDIQITLLRQFITKIPKEELTAISPFKITNSNTIEFKNLNQDKASTKFSFILNKYFQNLRNRLNNNPTTYIHKNSGIPLMGNVAFGIVYRNSTIIEIKPITSCNLNCVYCSISEGLSSKKQDYVIEEEYLIQELNKLLEFVEQPVEIHIGVQGEPFLYQDMELLISHLQKNPQINRISIDTNGTLITKDMLDRLSNNNKLQINFSLDAIDKEKAKKITGTKHYNVEHIKEMIKYAAEKNIKVLVAPVQVKDLNDDQTEKIIEFIKTIPNQPRLGIQNFLLYKTGRHPGKMTSWKDFYAQLKDLEKKHKIQLILSKEDFNVHKAKELPKPFKINDEVNAVIKCPDRFPNTVIAVAKGKNISVPNCEFKKDKKIKVKIIRDKHNIFIGKVI
jgi:hypothetical protein